MVDFSKIKLIIWDLDETLWGGVLSEGPVELPESNKQLIINLSKRGIVNSICSKNDLEPVKNELIKYGLWEYFIFPSINWEAKGQRVKDIIFNANLRAENVLFIDDNPRNLAEVETICDKIMVSDEKIIPELIDKVNVLGKDDGKLKRLNEYRVLEKKYTVKSTFNNEYDFLYSSHIKVCIKKDIKNDFDRIYELVFRANQLNYTKKRPAKEEFLVELSNPDYESASIFCRDDYGDYGLIGFYCLDKKSKELVHFLFSCRTMGMHIEQFVYQYLGFPKINVVQPVTLQLENKSEIDYITVEDLASGDYENKKASSNILMIGPCDLEAVAFYLEGCGNIDKEFRYFNEKGDLISYGSHSAVLNNIANGVKHTPTPFFDPQVYGSKIFSNKYDVIILSVILNWLFGEYENKNTGERIVFGECGWDATTEDGAKAFVGGEAFARIFSLSQKDYDIFARDYKFIGKCTPECLYKRLKNIIDKIPKTTKIILLLGSKIPYNKWSTKSLRGADKDSKIFNKLAKKLIKCGNVKLVDPTLLVDGGAGYTDCIQHYTRDVYHEIAQIIKCHIDNRKPKFIYKKHYKSYLKYCLKNFKKFLSRVKRKIFKRNK